MISQAAWPCHGIFFNPSLAFLNMVLEAIGLGEWYPFGWALARAVWYALSLCLVSLCRVLFDSIAVRL